VSWATVGQRLLGELPDPLIWVEFGSIAGKADQVEAMSATKEFLDQATVVRAAAIPQDEYVTGQMAQQVAEKAVRLLLLDVLEMKLEVEVEALAFRAN
jgi:hypothetical protein